MNVISHLDPILECVGWGCKKSRFLATWCIQFWFVIFISVNDTASWLVSHTGGCIFISIFHVKRKVLTYFIELLSLYKRGAERGEHPYAQSEYIRFFIIFSHFWTHDWWVPYNLQVSCAHPFPPPFFKMSKVWKYEAWGLIENVKWMSYLI